MKHFFTLISLFLPDNVATRYREEWWCDYTYADELGIPKHQVILGAIMTTLPSSARLPEMPANAKANYHAQMAFTYSGTMFLIGLGVWMSGFVESMVAFIGISLMTVGAISLSAYHLVSAVSAIRHSNNQATLYGLTALTALAGFGVLMVSGLFLALLLVLFTAASTIFALATMTPNIASTPSTTRLHLLIVPVYLLVAIFMLVHVYIINPLFAVPDKSLSEIYHALFTMGGGFRSPGSFTFGVLFNLIFEVAPLVAMFLAGWKVFKTPRKNLGLILLAPFVAAASVMMTSGFSMGMALADTLVGTGGDVSPYGRWVIFASLALAVPGIFLFLKPAAPRRPHLVE